MQFLQHGSLKYDPKAYKWRAEKADDSWAGLVGKLADIAKKNGLSTEKVTSYAQQAFVANRLKGLSKSDREIYSHMTPEQIEAGLKFFEMLPFSMPVVIGNSGNVRHAEQGQNNTS
jgi:hypothetical protein